MASKLTTRTTSKRDRKAGPVTQVTPPTNGNQPASDLAHTCTCKVSGCGRTWTPRAAKPAHRCACDAACPATTRRTFAQGHDAKAYGFLRKLGRQDGPKSKADKARLTHLRSVGFLGSHAS